MASATLFSTSEYQEKIEEIVEYTSEEPSTDVAIITDSGKYSFNVSSVKS